MSAVCISLFGRFCVRRDGHDITDRQAQKPQELLCYLLLNRDRAHTREVLADLLWADHSTGQSKQYLRKVLWQLQAALDCPGQPEGRRLLLADADWVQLNPEAGVWLDVADLEQAFAAVQGVPGRQLDAQQLQALRAAAALYRGDLLEGWYQDWCLYERERLQHMYLTMLDKLMDYCETHGLFEDGIAYGDAILRHEPAYERTHRRLMRLHTLARDRTAALRQYERCVGALRQELGVEPARQTVLLYEQICLDRPLDVPAEQDRPSAQLMNRTLGYLEQLQTLLADIQRQVQCEIRSITVSQDPEV